MNDSSIRQSEKNISTDPVVDGTSHVKNDRPAQPLSPASKKQRANIVSQLASEFIIFKQGLDEGRIQQYGADNCFFLQHKFLCGDWLTLRSIKSAALCQISKEKKQSVANTSL